MNIVGAWKRGYTGKDVVVTILDDGIERNHPDLIQNYVSLFYCRYDCAELLPYRINKINATINISSAQIPCGFLILTG